MHAYHGQRRGGGTGRGAPRARNSLELELPRTTAFGHCDAGR
jgi:hypothetical protein